MIITKLLESAPGVRSSARLVAVIFAALTVAVVLFCLWLAGYAIVHAKDHEQHAALAINSAREMIGAIGLWVLAPCIGGIWIALGMRQKGPDENTTTTTTQITQTGPAGAAPAVEVKPVAGG
jgi:hypothetical protein